MQQKYYLIIGILIVIVVGVAVITNNIQKTNKISELKVDGAFVAIGHTPNTLFLKIIST